MSTDEVVATPIKPVESEDHIHIEKANTLEVSVEASKEKLVPEDSAPQTIGGTKVEKVSSTKIATVAGKKIIKKSSAEKTTRPRTAPKKVSTIQKSTEKKISPKKTAPEKRTVKVPLREQPPSGKSIRGKPVIGKSNKEDTTLPKETEERKEKTVTLDPQPNSIQTLSSHAIVNMASQFEGKVVIDAESTTFINKDELDDGSGEGEGEDAISNITSSSFGYEEFATVVDSKINAKIQSHHKTPLASDQTVALSAVEVEEETETESEDSSDYIQFVESRASKSKSLLSMNQRQLFLDFSALPNIDDIRSTDTEEEDTKMLADEGEEQTTFEDVGVFVQPLSGEAFQESSSSTEFSLEEEIDEEEEEQLLEIESESEVLDLTAIADLQFDFGDILNLPTHDEWEPKIVDVEENALEALVAFAQDVEIADEDVALGVDDEEYKYQQMLKDETAEFLEELLGKIVATGELHGAEIKLRNSLNRTDLLDELSQAVIHHDEVTNLNRQLHRKFIEYCKRHQLFRFITPFKGEEKPEIEKYSHYIVQMDKVLEEEAAFEEQYGLLKPSIEEELIEAKKKKDETDTELEDLICKTILRNGKFVDLNSLVYGELQQMANLRQQISESRSILIKSMDTLARLKVQMDKFEKINDAVPMNTFISVQTEAQALNKKNIERTAELTRLRISCNADLQILTHIKEKHNLLFKMMDQKTSHLKDLRIKQNKTRQAIHKKKLERNYLRQRRTEMQMQGGLLHMPSLMYDYDNALKIVEHKRIQVSALRAELASITKVLANAKHT